MSYQQAFDGRDAVGMERIRRNRSTRFRHRARQRLPKAAGRSGAWPFQKKFPGRGNLPANTSELVNQSFIRIPNSIAHLKQKSQFSLRNQSRRVASGSQEQSFSLFQISRASQI